MNYKIHRDLTAPAYLQLYRQLRTDIVDGVYPYGARLPSKRLVSEELGISAVTVEHAYALLCDEGYAVAHERSGFFVAFRPSDGFAGNDRGDGYAVRAHPVPAPPADGGDGMRFPFSVLTKAMRRVISDRAETILERSPNAGMPELRAAIAQYLARSRGIHASPEQIVIGSGSEYLYRLLIDLLGRDLRYAFESPSYKKIEQVYRLSGVSCEALPLGSDGVETAALWQSDADVLHISPYRSFPSGVTASASKRHEYLRWASARPRFLIEDDFESEFSVSKKPEDTLFALSDGENVLYLNTFSKTVSPSLRMGYLVLPPRLLPAFRYRVGFCSCPVPTFEQLLLASLISSGDFERHINRVRRKKRQER